MEAKRPLSEEEILNSGTWGVAVYPSARSFIGRVSLIDFVDPYEVANGEGKPRALVPVEEVVRATYVTIFPAFDFFNVTLRPVPVRDAEGKVVMENGAPAVGMSREPMVNCLEFTCYDVPMHLKNMTGWYFFSQMNEADVASYKNFIRQARQQQKHFRQANSNIKAPTATEAEAIVRGHGGRRP
jgi:hypothetical protein